MTAIASLFTHSRPVPGLADLRAALSTMAAVSRQRAALRRLDAAALRDIGLTPAQAAREAARPFWDIDGTGAY